MSIGRRGRDPRNKTIDLHNGLVLHLNYDGADEVLDEMFKKITAELLESAKQVKALGELYDKQTAEHQARTAEHKAKTAEHKAKNAEHKAKTAEHKRRTAENEKRTAESEKRTAQNEIIAAEIAAKTAENKEKIVQLEEVLIVANKLGALLDTGTDSLKTLTTLQIEFKEQVNQRAELTNEIAAKIKICTDLLIEDGHDELEKQVTLLKKDFAKLAQSVEKENKAQDAVIDELDQLENVVKQMESTLDTITHQQNYYTLLKEKSYDIESDYLEKQNLALDANRPAKEGSDELGQQCEKAFSLIKQRLQQRKEKEAESPSSSRASTPPAEAKDSPLSRSPSDEEDDIITGRSSPSSSSQSQSSSDDESKKSARGVARSSTTSQLSVRLQSTENRSRSPSPQRQQPSQPLSISSIQQHPEAPEVSVALLGIHKPKPLTPSGEEIDSTRRKNNNGMATITAR